MKSRIDIKLITRVALLAAVVIVVQQFKFQYITGPLVNATLIITAFVAGIPGAVFLSLLSPALALAQGIMPNAALFPFIALGNLLYSVIFFLLRRRMLSGFIIAPPLKALIIAAGAYLVVGLPLPGAYAMGLSQLITAFAGAIIFVIMRKYLPFIND